jgi:hypothetical protein
MERNGEKGLEAGGGGERGREDDGACWRQDAAAMERHGCVEEKCESTKVMRG